MCDTSLSFNALFRNSEKTARSQLDLCIVIYKWVYISELQIYDVLNIKIILE